MTASSMDNFSGNLRENWRENIQNEIRIIAAEKKDANTIAVSCLDLGRRENGMKHDFNP